jgi:hypothetical protein
MPVRVDRYRPQSTVAASQTLTLKTSFADLKLKAEGETQQKKSSMIVSL